MQTIQPIVVALQFAGGTVLPKDISLTLLPQRYCNLNNSVIFTIIVFFVIHTSDGACDFLTILILCNFFIVTLKSSWGEFWGFLLPQFSSRQMGRI